MLQFILVLGFILTATASAMAGVSKPSLAIYATEVATKATSPESLSLDKEEITRGLEAALRDTRKFQIYERSDTVLEQSIAKEQDKTLSGELTGKGAQVGKQKNVQLLVYPLISEFKFGAKFEEVSGLPGMFTRLDFGRIRVTFKVLDTTTGEVKYQVMTKAGFMREPEVVESEQGGPAQPQWIKLAQDVAEKGAQAIVNAVFPIQVLSVQKGNLFLNRGQGGGIEVGEHWILYSAGPALVDPITGENLGAAEVPIGTIKIQSQTPKFSIGVPIGTLEGKPKRGDVIRRK